jgi:hypothetical protein
MYSAGHLAIVTSPSRMQSVFWRDGAECLLSLQARRVRVAHLAIWLIFERGENSATMGDLPEVR